MTLYLNRRRQKKKKLILLHNFNQLNKIYEKIISLPTTQGFQISKAGHRNFARCTSTLIEALLTPVNKSSFEKAQICTLLVQKNI